MPEIPDVIQGEPVEASWGNDIRDRTVQRYADAAERDTLNPVPAAGDLAYLADQAIITLFDGTSWQSGSAPGEFLPIDGSLPMEGGLTLAAGAGAGQLTMFMGSGFGLAFGADPNDAKAVRARFGGSDPANGERINLVAAGDVTTISLDGQGGRIDVNNGVNIGGLPVFAGQSTVMAVCRGTVPPSGFNSEWTAATGTLTIPSHWGSFDVMMSAAVHVAGGAATYQVRCAANINGQNGPFNQSGNSSQAPAAASSSSHYRAGLTGTSIGFDVRAIVDNTGGTLPTVTKYAHGEITATRVS